MTTDKSGNMESEEEQPARSLGDLRRQVHDRESFLDFVGTLAENRARQGTQGWENGTIEDYLFACCRWSQDWIKHEGEDEGTPGSPDEPMWRYFARQSGSNMERPGLKEEASWRTFADFLLAGKYYE